MFAIAWKDIRERCWVAALITLIAVAVFALLSASELLHPVAFVELFIFMVFAVSLMGALTFSDERARRTHIFLANLPASSPRIWASKAAASFVTMALIVMVTLYASWIVCRTFGFPEPFRNLEGLPPSFPLRLVLPLSFFWAMGLFFSVVFKRAAIGALVGTIVGVGLFLFSFQVRLCVRVAFAGFAEGRYSRPLTATEQALLVGLTILVPLAGSFLGYSWSRHRELRIRERGALLLTALGIWLLGSSAVIAPAVVRGLSSRSYASWVMSDGSGGFILACEGARRSWPYRIVHQRADGSVRTIREAVKRPVLVSAGSAGRSYAFVSQYSDGLPARHVIGLTFLKLVDTRGGFRGQRFEAYLEDPQALWGEEQSAGIMDLESGEVAPLARPEDDGAHRFPLGWDGQERFLVLEASSEGFFVLSFSPDGGEISRRGITFENEAWENASPVSAGMRGRAVYISAWEHPERLDLDKGDRPQHLQATYDIESETVSEVVREEEGREIEFSCDLSCSFVIDPPNSDIGAYHSVSRLGQQGGIDEVFFAGRRGDVTSTVTLSVVGRAGGEAVLERLHPGEKDISIQYRVMDGGKAFIALVSKRVEERERLRTIRVVRSRFLRVNLETGDVIEKEAPEGVRGLMVSPDGAMAILLGVKHSPEDQRRARSPRVPWISAYAASDLHLSGQFEWPERKEGGFFVFWNREVYDWVSNTEIVAAAGERVARISLATGQWTEGMVVELVRKGSE